MYVVTRQPFDLKPIVTVVRSGLTLEEMAKSVPGLPIEFWQCGIICINGEPIDRDKWRLIRPKAKIGDVPIQVDLRMPIMGGGGGGGDGGKNIFAMVAMLVVAVVGAAVTGGALGGVLGAAYFGAGEIGAVALGAAISIGGALAVNALTRPPSMQPFAEEIEDRALKDLGTAGIEGNTLTQNGPIPRVIGRHKVFPPFAANPHVYFDGEDEVVEAVYALAGPHNIGDIRIDGAPIGQLTSLDYQVKNGGSGALAQTLVKRQTYTNNVNTELRGFVVGEDGRTLETTYSEEESSYPQRQTVTTRIGPDSFWIDIAFPQGLHRNADSKILMRVPFRLRMRPIGGDWLFLPEIHFRASSIRQLRASIRFHWTGTPDVSPIVSNGEGWVEARRFSPGQVATPAGGSWSADPYFDSGGGADYISTEVFGGDAGVHRIRFGRFLAEFYLDELLYPRGKYEVEIHRGASFADSAYNPDTYTVSESQWNVFGVKGAPEQNVPYMIVESKSGTADTVALVRAISIWDEHPTPNSEKISVIALKARNRRIGNLSCVASGLVRDWDGDSWSEWKATSNPAPHLRDVALNNARGLPASMIDDATLVEWRAVCRDNDYTCDMIVDDKSVKDVWEVLASCGYASPYFSEIFTVARDYDRSDEAPVQIYTPRNSKWGGFKKAFPNLPDGFRVNFKDIVEDYGTRQIIVLRPGATKSDVLEEITFDGLVEETKVEKRAKHDLAQALYRSAFYTIDAPAESIVTRRGSLVEVSHDSISSEMGHGRIIEMELDGSGKIEALTLDSDVTIKSTTDFLDVPNMLVESNLLPLGISTGVKIRRSNSVTVHVASNPTSVTNRITFENAIQPDDIDVDTLVAVGPLHKEALRLIVLSITPREDLSATMTLVDEAPELF